MSVFDLSLIHCSEEIITQVFSKSQESGEMMKPAGLWLSVEGEQDWESWCVEEDFGINRLKYRHSIELSKDSNVLHIDNSDFLMKFGLLYRGYNDSPVNMYLRWKEIAEEYQGIIIAPYQYSCRLELDTSWYYGWDCASGCIWDSSAIDNIRLLEESS